MMRDNIKDKDYYTSFLNYQYERIEKKESKLIGADGEKRQRILLSLTGYEVDLIKAEFSAGASAGNLKTILIRAIGIISEYHNITYDDLLNLLSLTIILDAKDNAGQLIEANKTIIGKDRLLKFLALSIKNGSVEWDSNIAIREEYDALNQVFNAVDKEEALRNYLTGWYEAHSEYAWYDAHLKDTDTYCGYWSFESAAVVKILGLREERVKNIEYYPSL